MPSTKFLKIATVLTNVVLASSLLISAPSQASSSFNAAKKELLEVYALLQKEGYSLQSIYCGCPVSVEQKRGLRWDEIDFKACGYSPRKNAKRASRVEMEHVMPASDFGRQLKCWREGGRKNCSSHDKSFKSMEGEMHNLFPSIGEMNGDRGNMRFSDWNGKAKQYGRCPMVVDFDNDRVQPPELSRGTIARAYLFMEQHYKLKLSDNQKKLFEAWDRQHAPDKLECRRNELIQQIQGYANPFITRSCSTSTKADDKMPERKVVPRSSYSVKLK